MTTTCPSNIRFSSLLLLVCLLFMLPTEALAQETFSVEPRIGYGRFRMKHMKAFQQLMIRDIDLNAQATDEFPAFMVYGLKLAYSGDELRRIGLLLERGSTGGRVAYADYSGSLTADQLLTYSSLGIFVEDKNAIDELSPLQLLMGVEASLLYSSLILDSSLKVFNQQIYQREDFAALGVAVQPYLGISYPYKSLEGMFSLGYAINVNGQFHVKDNQNMVLDEEVKADWSGLRLWVSLQFKVF